MRERIYKALVKRYESEQEDALLKIDLLLVNVGVNAVMVDHVDITGEIDKLLAKCASATEKVAILRQHYGSN